MAGKTTWRIDPAHTTVEFAVKHMMFTTVRGRMKEVTGAIVVDEDNPDNSRVEVETTHAACPMSPRGMSWAMSTTVVSLLRASTPLTAPT